MVGLPGVDFVQLDGRTAKLIFELVLGVCLGSEPMIAYERACFAWEEQGRFTSLDACVTARMKIQSSIPGRSRGPVLCREIKQ